MTAIQEAQKRQIIELLATKDKAIARALVVLKNNQTADEQMCEATTHHNGRGFRPCHARVGTSMAMFYERACFLTPRQIAYWRKPNADGEMRISIYWRQIAVAMAEKAAQQKATV
jgi:hypothetical protein